MATSISGRVETCGCGCGTVSVGESDALNTCGCGCGSEDVAPKTAEQEKAELEALRDSIDRRLAELGRKTK
jgi:hypothetical protein